MSDTQQGTDWWQASDGKWYPPETAPGAQPAPPPPPAWGTPQYPLPQGSLPQRGGSTGKGCLIAFLIVLGLFVVGGIATVIIAGVAVDDVVDDATSEAGEPENSIYPDRPDQQTEDQEVRIGDSVRLSGYTATVESAGFEQQVTEFEDEGFIVATVKIENRDDESQPYNVFDWQLVTPTGAVIDPGFTSKDTLGSGSLVPGGEVEGDIVFEVGDETGDFYLIYKPDAFDAARGVWQVEV